MTVDGFGFGTLTGESCLKNVHCHTDRASWDAILVTVVAFGALMWEKCAQSHSFGLGRVGGGGGIPLGGGRGGSANPEPGSYTYIYIWSRAPRPPPPPPSMVYGPGCPPSCGMDCGFPLPPVGWLWGVLGFWGCGSSLSFRVLGLGSWVKRYKASSRQGLREGLRCRFVRVGSLCLV